MADIGPELPPHVLEKRKRDSGEDETGASRPPTPLETSRKKRILGPALPPAPLHQRPSQAPDQSVNSSSSSDDEDDGYGPALPSFADAIDQEQKQSALSISDVAKEASKEVRPSKRDEWMMLPPKQDDLAARMDPTKLRARGFHAGKSAKAPRVGESGHKMWTETPDQKRKRLQDEVLGLKSGASDDTQDDLKEHAKRLRDEQKAKQISEHNAQNRSQSLYAQHKRKEDKEEADDPSKRGFNYERDMSAAPKINHAQKREMLHKAADFGARFSQGSYL